MTKGPTNYKLIFFAAFCSLLGLVFQSNAQPGAWLNSPFGAIVESRNPDDSTRGNPSSTKIPSVQDNIRYGRLAIVGGGLLTVGVAHQLYVQDAWWKDYRRSFHFEEDLRYAKNIDKVAHFYAGMLKSNLAARTFKWSGFRQEKALWFGVIASSLFGLYVEIQDGFSTLWGFDRIDAAANIGGTFFTVARHYVPFLKNFDLKFSYLPSNVKSPQEGPFKNQKRTFLDDHEGQRFWLSFKVENLLPKSLKPVWPDFLCVALGLGARDLQKDGAHVEWYLALDYDLTALPGDSGFLRTLKEVLNLIHFPSPAIRISPNVVLYGLYFSL